ncbi:hypothetical protein FQN49_003580 [Arthroderma sp. PD_2]|nr:hypothetical protein FQN49_003580 [Arthroderma sp. PD_2]
MRFSSALALGLACLTNVGVIAKPTANGVSNNAPPKSGYKSVGYYVNWATYDREFDPQHLDGNQWSHILYAFADIAPSGELVFEDSYSNMEKVFAGDSQSAQGNNLHGTLNQMFVMKQKNRGLKTLLSVGGWSYSKNFALPASTPEGRQAFAKSCVKHLSNYGFDGIDIDWEYPKDDTEAKNLVLLLTAVKKALKDYSDSVDGYKYLLTVASPAGAKHYEKLHLKEMDDLIDFWNLMAYDYTGGWNSTTGHSANMYPSKNAVATPFNTQKAVLDYINKGVQANNIVLGFPLYGHAFAGTKENPGAEFNGLPKGSWEEGLYDYKDLPPPGADVMELHTEVASYSYDKDKGVFISYDTPKVVGWKANVLKQMGLGGAMWWETSADKKGDESLVGTVIKHLGGRDALDKSENQLNYPKSEYDNIKNAKKQ